MTWVNLDLPKEIHEKAKIKAIKAEKTIREYLTDVIAKEVRK